jgi:hypothetical protein
MKTEDYFDSLDSPMKEISKELRRIITAFSLALKEEIKWGVPTYSIKKNICSIMAHKKHVNFQIMRGAHLKDAQELEGTGKDMRHITFSSLDDIEAEKIENYLKQAIALDK